MVSFARSLSGELSSSWLVSQIYQTTIPHCYVSKIACEQAAYSWRYYLSSEAHFLYGNLVLEKW